MGKLEQHPIDAIKWLRHFLDHQHMIGEIGQPGRADHARQNREIEGGGGPTGEARFETSSVLRRQPGKRSGDGHVTAGPVDVDHHRSVDRPANPSGIKRAEQKAAIRITDVAFIPRRRAERGHHQIEQSIGAIAAAAEPDRIERRIVGEFEECRGAILVRAREMPVAQETLRVHDQFNGREGERDERLGLRRRAEIELSCRCHDADPQSHPRSFRAKSRNGRIRPRRNVSRLRSTRTGEGLSPRPKPSIARAYE